MTGKCGKASRIQRFRSYNRLPRARDRAWQSMRILRTFKLPDLMATAEIGHENAKKYVLGLTRAGYIAITQPCRSGYKGGHTVYRLIRNTGPSAPRLQTNGRTYDVNENKLYDGGIEQ